MAEVNGSVTQLAILGTHGQVGRELAAVARQRHIPHRALGRAECDITDPADFIALKAAALSSPALRAFFMKVKNLSSKVDVVNTYETRLAPTLQAAGLRCEVLFPAQKAHNPSLAQWRELILSGLPFVKLAALRDHSRGFGKNNWRKVLRAQGFDARLAEEALNVGAETVN